MHLKEFRNYSDALRTIGQKHSADVVDRLIKIIEEQKEKIESYEKVVETK